MYARIGAATLLILALGNQPATPQARNSFDGFKLVDKSGNIQKPADYRDLYQTLGTYVVLDPKGGNQMHLTYASPGAADYYRRNKKFADGTVLVKEVFGTDHAQMTTGDAHWAKGTKGSRKINFTDSARWCSSIAGVICRASEQVMRCAEDPV
jgi:hypothetical protein